MIDDESPNPLQQRKADLLRQLEELELLERLAAKHGISIAAPGDTSLTAIVKNTTEASAPDLVPHSFDGTIAGLIKSYRTHPRSPYHKLKHSVRNTYKGGLDRIVHDIGPTRVSDMNAERVKQTYDRWTEGGKTSLGHGLIAKLRFLSGFGATILDDPDCIRFASIMRTMRFKAPPVRVEQMTSAYATAIRVKARELGWPSISLAQAIQFELKLRSVDVIGEWVPISDPVPSDIIWGNEKWVRGLRWSDIDDKMVLRFSLLDRLKRKRSIEVDLRKLPMVREELDLMGRDIPTTGPLIICEPIGRPYSAHEFRRKWRKVAVRAGVPDTVRNGDSIRAEPTTQLGLKMNSAGA